MEQSKLQVKHLASSAASVSASTSSKQIELDAVKSKRRPSLTKDDRHSSHYPGPSRYDRYQSERRGNEKHSNYRHKFENNCTGCGNRCHHEGEHCPARGVKCYECGGHNHFAKCCKKSRVHNLEYVNEDSVSSSSECENNQDETLFNDSVHVDYIHNNIVTSYVILQKQLGVNFKVDTGAACNILPGNIFKKLKKVELRSDSNKLVAYGGASLPVLGKCRLKVKVGSKRIKADFFVVDLESKPLLGLKTSLDLGLVKLSPSVDIHNVSNDDKSHILEEYQDVFSGLGKVKGKYSIKVDQNAVPSIQPPRNVALAVLPKLKQKLKTLEKIGVISKAKPSPDWVSNLVIAEKKDGTLRICLDPPDLNNAIKRQFSRPPSPEVVSSKLHGMKVFSVVDMSDCYWHQELTEDSADLCTFNTPFGRMRFNRMPFGISCASDVAQEMVNRHFGDLQNVLPIHDDLIVAGRDYDEHDKTLKEVFERARASNIKFNRKKIQYRVNQVKYMGELVGSNGFQPDPDKVKAIQEFPTPKCRQDVQRLLGMTNYVARFIENMSSITEPLRLLLRKEILWQWNSEHEEALKKLRMTLCTAPVLQYYNVNKAVVLQVDASISGLGACLLQDEKPVTYASRSLAPAEQNYANIERELLAIVYACERFHQYTFGREIIIHTDHKPLEAIIHRSLAKAPPRLQRLLLRLQKYTIKVKWVPGKSVKIADCLSRAPLPENEPTLNEDDEEEIRLVIHSLDSDVPMSASKISDLKGINESDSIFKELHYFYQFGWPSKRKVPEYLHAFWDIQDQIHVANGILMYKDRLLIPESWKCDILQRLHACHGGIEKTKARARQTVYWPGINKDIEVMITSCDICAKYVCQSQKQPMKLRTVPERPWQYICADLLEYRGEDYIVVNDYYSKFIVKRLKLSLHT